MSRECPRCHSREVETEKRPNGNSRCRTCHYSDLTANFPWSWHKDDPTPTPASTLPPADFHSLRLLLDGLIVDVHRNAREHGWHDEDRNDGECIALMHSELSEALEALRNGNPKDAHCPDFSALEVELADVVLRVLDFAGMRNLNVAGAIIAKHKYNQQRPRKHGGKRF